MKWILLLMLLVSNAIASTIKYEDYYDFLQPLMVNIDENQTQNSNREKLLSDLAYLAHTAPHSNKLYYINYKLMQEFQYLHFHIKLKENRDITREEELFYRDKKRFIKILDSIKEPSFFTLYSKLYLETLDNKKLKNEELLNIYSSTSSKNYPYVQLLSYIDSINQLKSISLVDQDNLYKKLTLLLFGLPKEQETYLLRLTALQLLPLYYKGSIEFELNKLFAQKHTIKREDILRVLNYKDADLFKAYIEKKKRSFFEARIFKATMKALKRHDVAMILSRLYMQKNDYNSSRSYIRQTPRDNIYSPYNPFSTSIELNNSRVYKHSSSLRKFAETMSRLEERLGDKEVTAKDFYLYGNGLYNKSCFGNFPTSSVFFNSKNIYLNHIPPTCELKEAQKHYESALNMSTEDKFKAEVAYHLLKIEFYKALTNRKNYPKGIKKIPKITEHESIKNILQSSKNFIEAVKDYKLNYRHTKYGKRAIKESLIFNYL
jgi:aspartate 1-decarboxylase